jgi:radical SAM protein with 4Fe4S-binding SPASM domain
MYYTKLNPDLENEELVILQEFFDVRLSNPEPLQLSENSLLSFVNTRPISLDEPDKKGKLLLFNSSLATWCFLEGRERSLYDYLHEGTQYSTLLTASMLKVNGWGGPERINKILAHLYARGMLLVDGNASLNQEIYREGPLYKDLPMMELLITRKCNLGCAYCFAASHQKQPDMELETALNAVDQLMAMPFNNFYIKFNGGEPLLRKDLLEKISSYTLKKFREIKGEGFLLFEITTNGTLVDEEAIELFRKFNMRVLISIDGPEHLHNKYRTYKNSSPSFGDVIKGIQRMQDADYPFRVITVVARENLPYPGEIIDFFSYLGITNLRFNPILKHGHGKDDWEGKGIEPQEYLSFMKVVAARCCEGDSLHEDNLESMLRNMVSRTRDFKCMRSNCGCGHYYLCIDSSGDIYPCAFFLGEIPGLKLGNIHQEGVNLGECGRDHPLVKTLPSRSVGKIATCSQCQWRHLCEGGCTLGAYLKSGTIFAPSYLCDYYKGMYSFLFNRLAKQPDSIMRLLNEEVKGEHV